MWETERILACAGRWSRPGILGIGGGSMAIWDMRSCRHFSQAIGSRIVRALFL